MKRPVTLNIICDVTNQLSDFSARLSLANQDGNRSSLSCFIQLFLIKEENGKECHIKQRKVDIILLFFRYECALLNPWNHWIFHLIFGSILKII